MVKIHDGDCDCAMFETWPIPPSGDELLISGGRRSVGLRHPRESWHSLGLPLNWLAW